MVDFPTDQLWLILYGRVVDTSRAREAFGFSPRYKTEEALCDFRDNRAGSSAAATQHRPSWERELIGYMQTAAARESV